MTSLPRASYVTRVRSVSVELTDPHGRPLDSRALDVPWGSLDRGQTIEFQTALDVLGSIVPLRVRVRIDPLPLSWWGRFRRAWTTARWRPTIRREAPD